MKIVLLGSPISTNALYRRGRGNSFYMIQKAHDLKENYQWQIKSQYKKKPIKEQLSIKISLYFGNKRSHDWDNYHKIAMDACNKLLWEDDSQVMVAIVSKHYEKNNPRIEITL